MLLHYMHSYIMLKEQAFVGVAFVGPLSTISEKSSNTIMCCNSSLLVSVKTCVCD